MSDDIDYSSIGGKMAKFPHRNLWRHCREMRINLATNEVHDMLYARDVRDLKGVVADAERAGIRTDATRKKIDALQSHTTEEIAELLNGAKKAEYPGQKCPYERSGDPADCHNKCPVAGNVMEKMVNESE